jgi:hypothetical protein
MYVCSAPFMSKHCRAPCQRGVRLTPKSTKSSEREFAFPRKTRGWNETPFHEIMMHALFRVSANEAIVLGCFTWKSHQEMAE